MDRELEQLIAAAAPRTVQLLGISTGHAGQLLVTAGQNIERVRSESSFSMLCGASPIPASSGKTTRHRLNYGGDRQANRALHLIAVCRMRYCERTRAYVKRRTAEGKTKREIMRSLKRYIAREVYNSLRADLAKNERPRPIGLAHHHVRQPRLRNQPNPHLTSIGTSQLREVPEVIRDVAERLPSSSATARVGLSCQCVDETSHPSRVVWSCLTNTGHPEW